MMENHEESEIIENISKKLRRDRTRRDLGEDGVERARAWLDKIVSTCHETDKQQKMILKYYCKQLFQQVEQGKLTTPFNRPPPKVTAEHTPHSMAMVPSPISRPLFLQIGDLGSFAEPSERVAPRWHKKD